MEGFLFSLKSKNIHTSMGQHSVTSQKESLEVKAVCFTLDTAIIILKGHDIAFGGFDGRDSWIPTSNPLRNSSAMRSRAMEKGSPKMQRMLHHFSRDLADTMSLSAYLMDRLALTTSSQRISMNETKMSVMGTASLMRVLLPEIPPPVTTKMQRLIAVPVAATVEPEIMMT